MCLVRVGFRVLNPFTFHNINLLEKRLCRTTSCCLEKWNEVRCMFCFTEPWRAIFVQPRHLKHWIVLPFTRFQESQRSLRLCNWLHFHCYLQCWGWSPIGEKVHRKKLLFHPTRDTHVQCYKHHETNLCYQNCKQCKSLCGFQNLAFSNNAIFKNENLNSAELSHVNSKLCHINSAHI